MTKVKCWWRFLNSW